MVWPRNAMAGATLHQLRPAMAYICAHRDRLTTIHSNT